MYVSPILLWERTSLLCMYLIGVFKHSNITSDMHAYMLENC